MFSIPHRAVWVMLGAIQTFVTQRGLSVTLVQERIVISRVEAIYEGLADAFLGPHSVVSEELRSTCRCPPEFELLIMDS